MFLRSGGLARLNEMRENCVLGWVVSLQAICRRHLGLQKLRKLKVTKASSNYTLKNAFNRCYFGSSNLKEI